MEVVKAVCIGHYTLFCKAYLRTPLTLEIPPLLEQVAIATVLSSLDNKIDLLHRQNATLEKMAETLFRQWFVEEVSALIFTPMPK